MIAILDPALFLTKGSQGPLAADEEREMEALVDDVSRLCRDHHVSVLSADSYWPKLQKELVRPLYLRAKGPRLRQGLNALQHRTRSIALAPSPPAGGIRMWGVKMLFGWSQLAPDWLSIMEQVLLGCVSLAEPVVLVTRLFPGRNMVRHQVQGTTLTEKTRWRVYVHVAGSPPLHVRCVRNARNVAVPWTARFDERLPDGGTYPFCPPASWWLRRIQACRTFKSKPAWIDRFGNGWVQPATGGFHHWDVFLEDQDLQRAVGLNQINVVTWGTTEKGKAQGTIHHVPGDKKAHFKGGGWTCPDHD
jgi:hypothetical protein